MTILPISSCVYDLLVVSVHLNQLPYKLHILRTGQNCVENVLQFGPHLCKDPLEGPLGEMSGGMGKRQDVIGLTALSSLAWLHLCTMCKGLIQNWTKFH